jgi:hypothetical protein
MPSRAGFDFACKSRSCGAKTCRSICFLGRRLRLSTKTVETHRLHVREKLQLESGPVLIQYAVRWPRAQRLL